MNVTEAERMIRREINVSILALLVALLLMGNLEAQGAPNDPRLKKASILPARNGWTFVDLEGATVLEMTHDTHKDWNFFRDAARNMMWPHIEKEYREELQGIAEGLKARGLKLDVWDVVALNAAVEWSYYASYFDQHHGIKPPRTVTAPDRCSAFVATGSYTKDGKVVMGHNDWTDYLDGARWTIVYDIVPQ